MTFLPCVVRADYVGGFRVRLTFNDLSKGTVDFRSWLDGPIFAPLKESARFREFFVDGGTVAWPNGADIAPETLYEAVRRQMKRTRSSRQRPLGRQKVAGGR